MSEYLARIGCRQAGAIGTMYHIKRQYIITADDREDVNELAIKRAYQDGDIEHVLVESVRRYVEPYDLELYTINTGAFYQRHKEMAAQGASLRDWKLHVEAVALPGYSCEIEAVIASAETVETVARALQAYYVRHLQESAR